MISGAAHQLNCRLGAQFTGERRRPHRRMLLDILVGKQIALCQMQGYQVILRELTK